MTLWLFFPIQCINLFLFYSYLIAISIWSISGLCLYIFKLNYNINNLTQYSYSTEFIKVTTFIIFYILIHFNYLF